MASKMFMGDMPELMENILNNLNNEFYSLYSCALVSRHWCKMTIPILWQNPFSFDQNPLFISQYFSSLDENEKLSLKECGINVKFPKTLFNYAKFLKVFDLSCIEKKVKKWIYFQHVGSKPYLSSKDRIINLLFKLFVESGAILYKLDLYFSDYDLYFFDYEINPEIFYSLGRNEQFFSRLQDLSLGGIPEFNIESVIALLGILAKNTTKINVLKIEEFYSYYEPRLLHALEYIIKSQEQIRQFSLIGGEEYPTEFHGIVSALECQKQSLQEATIENCDCDAEFKVLMNCKNLKILRIRDCGGNEQVLEASLNTLEITDSTNFTTSIAKILERSGSVLQRLKLKSLDENIYDESLLRTLKSFCPDITYLNISCIGFSKQLLELIDNLQKLQFLTLWFKNDSTEEELKMRVIQFAKILPLTLQYLDLMNGWLNSYIDVLLNHCDAPLKKLLINHLINEKNAKAIIDFCIRSRTLDYVGFKFSSLNNNIKKEVEGYVTLVPCELIIVNC